MKSQQLKKRLLLESGIIAGSLAVMGLIAFFLDDFSDDYKKSKAELESQVQAITSSTSTLSGQYENVRRNNQLLKKILELQSKDGLTINPQIAKNSFNRFRDHYYLANMHLSMAPVTEMQDPSHKSATSVMISSQVSVDFEGLSDEYAYGLLDAMEENLPGGSKITNLTLTRQQKVTSDILRTISETGVAPLVRGEVKFIWFGIKPVETSDTANAPKKP